jgi:hypothetical protein
VHVIRGPVLLSDPNRRHPSVRSTEDPDQLLRILCHELVAQTSPVVEALFEYSGFVRHATWGPIISSWAALFVNVFDQLSTQPEALPLLEAFFKGNDDVARMQPRFHTVTLGNVTHLYQRRASCCRYYFLPQGSLCASCPLASQEDRVRMNREWMQKRLEKKPSWPL